MVIRRISHLDHFFPKRSPSLVGSSFSQVIRPFQIQWVFPPLRPIRQTLPPLLSTSLKKLRTCLWRAGSVFFNRFCDPIAHVYLPTLLPLFCDTVLPLPNKIPCLAAIFFGTQASSFMRLCPLVEVLNVSIPLSFLFLLLFTSSTLFSPKIPF